MESKIKAKSPSPMIISVCKLTNWSAFMEKEIVIPRTSVIRFASVVCAVSERLFKQPHSRIRFPNIRNPTRATDAGATSPATNVTMIGKAILVNRLTFPGSYGMRIMRSFFVVTALIAIGWMIGTSAI